MMGCTPCGKKKKVKNLVYQPFTVMGDYKYLNSVQISKRLETFKKLFCEECDNKTRCDYGMYKACRESKGQLL